jgi:hypothetical protein
MQTFTNTRAAKEFLIDQIVEEAAREGVSMSETERKMLYFSETAWSLPDIMDVNNAFEREYDTAVYEEKIGTLVSNFREWAGKAEPSTLKSWDEAVRILSTEDHYLLVLLNAGKRSADLSLVDKLKLTAVAFVIVIVLLATEFLFRAR